MTTSAAKDMFLPPLTTLVTRLIETTSSLRLSRFASSFFFITAICCPSFWLPRSCPRARPKLKLEFQTGLARCLGKRLHATVVKVSATIKDHLLDALFLRALSDELADRLGRSHVTAVCFAIGIVLLAERRCGDQGDAVEVVDELRI